jgi:hypothetical protein
MTSLSVSMHTILCCAYIACYWVGRWLDLQLQQGCAACFLHVSEQSVLHCQASLLYFFMPCFWPVSVYCRQKLLAFMSPAVSNLYSDT